MYRQITLAVLATTLLLSAESNAAIQFFTTLPSWQSAVGTTNAVEDFEGFTQHTPFTVTSGPVALAGGMSIVEVGTTTGLSPRNRIDVAPFEISSQSPNGSTFANMNLDVPDHHVRIDFSIPARAWGADFAAARGGAYLTLGVRSLSGEIGNMVIPTNDSFLGFQATAGESIISVFLRGDSGPTTEEDLGMDNARLALFPSRRRYCCYCSVAYRLTVAQRAADDSAA